MKICLLCNQANDEERTHCSACNAPLPAVGVQRRLEDAPSSNEVVGEFSTRRMLGLLAGVFLFVLALTGVFFGMRAVMAVGGSCADGGPYQIRVPCPKGGGFSMVVFIYLGLAGYFVNARSAIRGMPLWSSFFWTIGFCLLGGNFLQAGIQAARATAWSMAAIGLGLGLFFVAMGLGRLILIGNVALLWSMLIGSSSSGESNAISPRIGRIASLGLHFLAASAGAWLALWYLSL